jgi:hypothetical protein
VLRPYSRPGGEEEEPPGSRVGTPYGTMCPITSGRIGVGSRKMRFGPFVNFAICCPLPTTNCAVIGTLETEYKTAIPPYYFSLINPEDPADPIRLQSVPSPLEQDNPSGYELEDPLEEDKDMPVPGLTHRYPDRCLLVTTHVCTMYCRFAPASGPPWFAAAGMPSVAMMNV